MYSFKGIGEDDIVVLHRVWTRHDNTQTYGDIGIIGRWADGDLVNSNNQVKVIVNDSNHYLPCTPDEVELIESSMDEFGKKVNRKLAREHVESMLIGVLKGSALLAVDVSNSMTVTDVVKQLEAYTIQDWFYKLLDRFVTVAFNTEIKYLGNLRGLFDYLQKPIMGGGTDIKCVLEKARHNDLKEVVLFTDGNWDKMVLKEYPEITVVGINEQDRHTFYNISEKRQSEINEDEPKCWEGKLPWPYNATIEQLQCLQMDCGAMYINGRIVKIIIEPKEALIKVNCFGCNHTLQEIKLTF